ITGIDPQAKAIAPATVKPAEVPDVTKLPPRKEPPVIILKLDDFRPVNGKVHNTWKRLDKYLADKNIKYTAGIICSNLNTASPEFVEWTKTRQRSGAVEFWFHGWDHGCHDVNGAKYSEFGERSYEEQRKRFDDSQKVAFDTLGFHFATFGPPGGGKKHFDANTIKAMAEEPNMKVWLYCQPLDKAGAELAKAGKVTILDRVWAVNLEGAVGSPDYNRLISGYAKNPNRAYFVLQGHPTHWSGGKFDEFTRIIDFLVDQKAVFVTPSAYAASLKTSAGE
ncbi:MAG: DUF2334 domain-containing protein, partial [Planctomycetes bacterium]|nr:DUF2334 domain-containing protein [Planctomycetota bacterium]